MVGMEHRNELYRFSSLFIRDPNGCALGDRGVTKHQCLDIFREHAIPGTFDHFLDSAREEQVAVFVKIANVPGMDPAIAQRFGRRIRSFPIAFENTFVTNYDLTALSLG